MSDLISREDVIKIIDEEIKAKTDYLQHNAQIDIMYKVQELPTVEARPVVHGEWIGYMADNKEFLRDDGEPVFLICSSCKTTVLNNGSYNWNFCPNCGCSMKSDMRGGKND